MALRLRPGSALRIAALVAAGAVATSCVGSPPPPRKDLAAAVERTAGSDDAFEFSLWAKVEFEPVGAAPSLGHVQGEVLAEGSSRQGRGFRALVRKKPVLWKGPRGNAPPDGSEGGAVSPAEWLVVEEVPGAVRAPGHPIWFSGRSGAMDLFGGLAHALPPLGSPDTVFARISSFLPRLGEPSLVGVGEARGHPVEIYSLGPVGGKASPPAALVDSAGRAVRIASPSPTPTSLDGSGKEGLAEAAWSLLYGDIPDDSITDAIRADVRYSVSSRVFVDQIDTRIRRVETTLAILGPDAAVKVQAASDYWGFDSVGEFKIPVDTTFVAPDVQDMLRQSGFVAFVPTVVPPGLEFTGLERASAAGACDPLTLAYTGRGRSGHVRIWESPEKCGPSIPRTPNASTSSPRDSEAHRDAEFVATDTPSGARMEVRTEPDVVTAYRKVDGTWVSARAEGGISVRELVEMLDWLAPLELPIPPELSLPLPQQGPERR